MRIAIDTNVLLSGLIRPDGPPADILRLWFDNRFVLLCHELQLAELRDTTRRPHLRARFRRGEAGRLVNRLRRKAEMIQQLPHVQRSNDPRDDFLLAMCEAGEADYLVTGDKADLLVLRRHGGAVIISARDFVERMG